MDNLRASWPVHGLARRYPVRDLETMQTLLKIYASLFPEELPYGVRSVSSGGTNDDFYMATNGHGDFWFREVEYGSFNSRRDLFGAFDKCAKGQLLTQNEEYALESLWHEILHNRQTGMDEVDAWPRSHTVRILSESLHQLVSRLTYPRFIERLGTSAQYQLWILENGYGYRGTVSRLRRIIQHLGLNEMDIKGKLSNLDRDSDLTHIVKNLGLLLAKISKMERDTIQAALRRIDESEDEFEAGLALIRSL